MTKVATACALALPAAAQPHLDGLWSQVYGWPLIAAHAALTPDGRVLTYGTNGDGTQTGYFIYDIWDPSAGPGGGHTDARQPDAHRHLLQLADHPAAERQILIAGGDNWTGTGTTNTGNNNSNLFDHRRQQPDARHNMNRARWYSSSTVLVNGEVYIQGGAAAAIFRRCGNRTARSGCSTRPTPAAYDATFPRNFLAPDGRVFGYDTNGTMYYVNTGGIGSARPQGLAVANAGWTSSAAMFRPGRILQMGGNSNAAVVIDINGPVPVVTPTEPMSSQRQWVSGHRAPRWHGARHRRQRGRKPADERQQPRRDLESRTGNGTRTAGVNARLYHSAALLLPDATVLSPAAARPVRWSTRNAEIYYPPYLFDAAGAFAPRPQIVTAPTLPTSARRSTIEVERPTSAASRSSRPVRSRTASTWTSASSSCRSRHRATLVSAQLPARATDTPPGFYMLFVDRRAGVPSIARRCCASTSMRRRTPPSTTRQRSAAAAAARFSSACAADETLVGVHGRFGDLRESSRPAMRKVDQFGQWIGDPVKRARHRHDGDRHGYTKTCPRDFGDQRLPWRAASTSISSTSSAVR